MYHHVHIINTKNAPASTGPYAQAIDTGNIIFISGQIPICSNTNNTMPENICDQTHQALQNIRNILKTINLKINNIIKITLFITNMDDLSKINSSYKKFFDIYSSHDNDAEIKLPARSCVEVSKLPKNAKIEIDAIAIRS